MINLGRLKNCISDRGVSMVHVAKKAGTSKESLRHKLAGDVEFKISEIIGIREALRLTDAEFLELLDGGTA